MQKIVRYFNRSPIRIAVINGQHYMAAHDVSEALKFENPKGEVVRFNMEQHGHKTQLIDWEPNFKEFVVDIGFVIDLTLRAQRTITAQFIGWMVGIIEEYVIASQGPLMNNSNHNKAVGNYYAITQIAKKYGLTGKALNDILCECKVQYKVNDQWVLHLEFQDRGYTFAKLVPKRNSENDVLHTYWTDSGMKFIESLLRSRGLSEKTKEEQMKLF